ncbi:MAG TPA: hypothetical protein VII41_11135, partial [Steroidobacteraceae bacterium]
GQRGVPSAAVARCGAREAVPEGRLGGIAADDDGPDEVEAPPPPGARARLPGGCRQRFRETIRSTHDASLSPIKQAPLPETADARSAYVQSLKCAAESKQLARARRRQCISRDRITGRRVCSRAAAGDRSRLAAALTALRA